MSAYKIYVEQMVATSNLTLSMAVVEGVGDFFICQDLVASTGVRKPPLSRGYSQTKNLKKKNIHTPIHTTTAHTLLSTPGAVPPDIVSAF